MPILQRRRDECKESGKKKDRTERTERKKERRKSVLTITKNCATAQLQVILCVC